MYQSPYLLRTDQKNKMLGKEVVLSFSAGQQSPVQSPGQVLGPVPVGQRRVFLL